MTELAHKTATVDGTTIHYVDAGSGPLVVMLHGFPESWYSWRNQIPKLVEAGYRVIAPDLRGYGDSDKPREVDAYKLTCIVKDIAGLIVQSGDSPCVLVGHDWGGVAAWFVPMIHPELVRKLIVLNSPHPVPFARELRRSKEQKVRMIYQLFFQPPVLAELFARLILTPMMKRAGRFTAEDIAVYQKEWRKPGTITSMLNYYRALRRHRRDLRALVRPIEIPTLLIWGERDPVFIRATTENFSDYVPNLRVERIRAGHFVQTDAAERVSELMVEFAR